MQISVPPTKLGGVMWGSCYTHKHTPPLAAGREELVEITSLLIAPGEVGIPPASESGVESCGATILLPPLRDSPFKVCSCSSTVSQRICMLYVNI